MTSPPGRSQTGIRPAAVDNILWSQPAYLPALVLDSLWWIVATNRAHDNLVPSVAPGQHFFTLYFSEEFRQMHTGDTPWSDLTWMAMSYFERDTEPFVNTPEYNETIEYLSQWEEFAKWHRELTEGIKPRHPKIKPPSTSFIVASEHPLIVPNFPQTPLWVKSTVRRISAGQLDESFGWYEHLVLQPGDQQTRAGLALLHLSDTLVLPWHDYDALQQLLVGLALSGTALKSIEIGEEDIKWNPVETFGDLLGNAEHRYKKDSLNMSRRILNEFKANIYRIISETDERILDLLICICYPLSEVHKLLLMERDNLSENNAENITQQTEADSLTEPLGDLVPGIQPLIRVSFGSTEDLGNALLIVSQDKPTVGLPHRSLIVDIQQLERLKESNIPVYDPTLKSRERYNQPMDIEEVISRIRSQSTQG